MSLVDILWLYRARLRARAVLVQECFAIIGIAVGVALLFASQVASTSLTHSVSQLNSQLVGNTQFQVDARGPGGFSERLLEEVRRVPGVKTALPVLEQQANVIGPGGTQRSVDLIGTDPRFAHFAGALLRRFSAAQLAAQRAIALPAPLAEEIGAGPLQTIKIQIGASVVQTLLGATLGEADIGGLVHSPVALAPVGYAQAITGMKVGSRASSCKLGLDTNAKYERAWSGWPLRRPSTSSPATSTRPVRSRRVPREPERGTVLRNQRAGGFHVRAERNVGDGALAADTDRRHPAAGRHAAYDLADSAV